MAASHIRPIWTATLAAAAVSWLGIALARTADTTGTPVQTKQGYVAFQHHTLHLLESSDVPPTESVSESATRKKVT